MKKIIAVVLKKHLLFLILIPIVVASQYYLLAPHLKFGLIDLDDGYTYGFILSKAKHTNVIDFLTASYKEWQAVYLHQFYYVGLLNHFFGDNFLAFHYVTQFFKIIATLSIYPLFFILSGSSLVAFISVIFYAFSYSAAGALESVIQSSDYPAIFMLSIFLSIYFYLIRQVRGVFKPSILFIALLFLLSALIFSTERTYPIIPLIVIVEFILFLNQNTSQPFGLSPQGRRQALGMNDSQKNLPEGILRSLLRSSSFFLNKSRTNRIQILKRMGVLLGPIFLLLIFQPRIVVDRLTSVLVLMNEHYVLSDQMELLLIPFASFVSTILPTRYWFGQTWVILLIITPTIAFAFSKKPIKFIAITAIIWSIDL